MGPLKKRRKKKRKGSTSSESSCNQPNVSQDAGSSQEAVSDDHKTEQLLKIKQEIIDSPNSYLTGQQQQMLPMNLATEPRSNAVRNLTPKLMELQAEQASQQPMSPGGLIIKDEAEEYNTTNIFCKKVLKAQQTKGFWANSPSSGSTSNLLVPPVITTTAATPPPSTQPPPDHSPVTVTPLSMGPPAQLNHQSSVSPSSSLDTNSSTPKVASRNMMLLRAKRIMAENAAALAAAEDSGLPENLGLPRERVISICNMDKHELDDYFLPGDDEEENSEGPDTELLQYFQIGDAEEKQLNSLDAQAEQHRNPQAASATAITNAMATATATAKSATAATATTAMQQQLPQQQQQLQQQQQQQQLQQMRRSMPLSTSTVAIAAANVVGSASASLALMSRKHQQQQQQQLRPNNSSSSSNNNNNNNNNNNSNKRKISLTNASSNGSNKNCIFLPISPNSNGNGNGNGNNNSNNSCNTAPGITAATSTTGQPPTQNCFASPGLTRMRQRSSLLTKQQSLDFDNNANGDPMIGAHRRRRSYVYSYPSSSSASAPPSPSLLQQCMGANWSFNGNIGSSNQFHESNSNNTNANNNNAELLVNQNSMDLETSLALSGANMELNETQRSQSVPLSQLQRSSTQRCRQHWCVICR